MKRIDWSSLDAAARADCLARPGGGDQAEVEAAVRRVFEQVRADGDTALRALTRRFDGVEIADFAVTPEEFEAARAQLPAKLRVALAEARSRLVTWHRAGMAAEFEVDTAPGVRCGRLLRPIPRVGLYVPAGTAPLPSTALMLGVPAELAGCADVVLCTPPRADGTADPAVLVAAALCGITRVFKLGGAQAIAAMAFGTPTLPRCDKLFGPGNRYVTAAKQLAAMLAGGPAIDMPAGPSEVLVIADAGAPPAHVAADLLSQAEHGPDSQVILVTDSAALIDAVEAEVARQLAELPREAIAQRALEHARLMRVSDIGEAFAISNAYAPEHLILALRQPRTWLDRVASAGSVFLGDYAPESLGDYCSGTNHVLPTNGAARAWSGVSVASFQTSISVQEVSREGLAAIGPCAVEIARAEGLEAHAQAVLRRLEAQA
ncbi:histidinol dehydrogenase [Arenimonas terrae]|uniref:Histidinol dehydrogenase n=1 Tax=Arenimonas terrae TaxID=2546226 RepID=A0A5C4RV43_9GAMM|nr:histidinol dehydrogenase [Arenimonas terrae]TNJ34874.1 histidinol dehydrogenase [Arenimonas terrae]